MSSAPVNVSVLTRQIIELAHERGAQLSYDCAWKAATATAFLQEHGLKVIVRGLRELSADARFHARAFCNVLREAKGIDPTPYLKELDRLYAQDGQEAVWRHRPLNGTRSLRDRSPLFSERAYREAFEY